jgi:hypothetical protein
MTTARKGDLVLIETSTRVYVVGQPSITRTEYQFGVVASATREGIVKSWQQIGWGDELLSGVAHPIDRTVGFRKAYVLPSAEIDVTAALQAAKAHHWPGHPGQPMPFDSLNDARECVRPFRILASAS